MFRKLPSPPPPKKKQKQGSGNIVLRCQFPGFDKCSVVMNDVIIGVRWVKSTQDAAEMNTTL